MLIKYKQSYKKIAMGLLSYMPEEKDVKKLQETVQQYEETDDWQLFMWKEDDDIVGVVGLRYTENGQAELRHVCVNPSYRDEGIGKKMVQAVRGRLDQDLVASKETVQFLQVCDEHQKDILENEVH
ncbi:GNAT family N-acetyltransferase [Marinococcus luteus]|uniref:GNAT family N-acetyltransferase n=1 Tax=Marinococcus luteus TaxID=1122204 RepID=UPI002ACC4C38|nr:GNAT family N-acetyltransferase [Marinococcus luteus]MDZ5782357.1 GNAT family N-acetyltransferase [Marinococcus luteus]